MFRTYVREQRVPANDSTPDKILITAEKLFAEQGFSSTSLRQISSEAGVNLAAVNYHFGSKEALIHSLLSSRISDVSKRRSAALSSARDSDMSLESVLRAFLSPPFDLMQEEGAGKHFILLMARVHTESDPSLLAHMFQCFQPTVIEFTTALSEIMPELPKASIARRFSFTLAALVFTLLEPVRVPALEDMDSRHKYDPEVLEELVSFCKAGFLGEAA